MEVGGIGGGPTITAAVRVGCCSICPLITVGVAVGVIVAVGVCERRGDTCPALTLAVGVAVVVVVAFQSQPSGHGLGQIAEAITRSGIKTSSQRTFFPPLLRANRKP